MSGVHDTLCTSSSCSEERSEGELKLGSIPLTRKLQEDVGKPQKFFAIPSDDQSSRSRRHFFEFRFRLAPHKWSSPTLDHVIELFLFSPNESPLVTSFSII